jgi:hypothetical protein
MSEERRIEGDEEAIQRRAHGLDEGEEDVEGHLRSDSPDEGEDETIGRRSHGLDEDEETRGRKI